MTNQVPLQVIGWNRRFLPTQHSGPVASVIRDSNPRPVAREGSQEAQALGCIDSFSLFLRCNAWASAAWPAR
jgi:hypothetical protein